MSKSIITRLFVGGIVAVVAGILLAIAAVFIAYFSGAFVLNGADVTSVRPTPSAWTFVFVAIVGGLAIVGGSIAGLVAWIGALLNTAQLEDKTWFVLLLVLGLLSFGFVAMIAYLIVGPDATRMPQAPRRYPASA